jgi:hypothetical protein
LIMELSFIALVEMIGFWDKRGHMALEAMYI